MRNNQRGTHAAKWPTTSFAKHSLASRCITALGNVLLANRLPLAFLYGALCVASDRCGNATAQDPDLANKIQMQAELLSAIEAAFAAADAISPYELVGRTFSSEKFGEDVRDVDEMNFRLRFDLQNERAVWAYTRQKSPDPNNKTKRPAFGSNTVRAAIVDHDRLYECTSSRVNMSEHASFEDALIAGEVQHLRYWGVLGFPNWGNPVEKLLALRVRIGGENVKVTSSMSQSSVRYTLREDHQPGQFDILKWDFDLESHFLVRRSIERAAAQGILVPYKDEKHMLEVFMDTKRPFVMDHALTVVQRYTQRPGGRLGKMSTVTELGWITATQTHKPVDVESLLLHTPEEIVKYIADGKKLVVNVADKP